jgi:hypothetical protein
VILCVQTAEGVDLLLILQLHIHRWSRLQPGGLNQLAGTSGVPSAGGAAKEAVRTTALNATSMQLCRSLTIAAQHRSSKGLAPIRLTLAVQCLHTIRGSNESRTYAQVVHMLRPGTDDVWGAQGVLRSTRYRAIDGARERARRARLHSAYRSRIYIRSIKAPLSLSPPSSRALCCATAACARPPLAHAARHLRAAGP